MLDNKKIKLMTRVATYEQKTQKQDIAINRFSRKDYISLKLIISFFQVLIVFCVMLLMWAVYDADRLVDLINKYGLKNVIILIIIIYILITWFYLEFKYFSYSRKYYTSEIRIKKYQELLKKLNNLYEEDVARKQAEIKNKVNSIDIDEINIDAISIDDIDIGKLKNGNDEPEDFNKDFEDEDDDIKKSVGGDDL